RNEADEQDDRQRLYKGMDEFSDRVLDHGRLIGDLLKIESMRDRRHKFGSGAVNGRAKVKNIGAFRHYDPNANGRLAFLTNQELRRVGKTVRDRRNVAEPKHAPVRLDRRLRASLRAVQRAGY